MRKRAEMATCLALVLSSVLIASCAENGGGSEEPLGENAGGSEQPAAGSAALATDLPENPTWGRAIVTGDLSELSPCEQKFKEVLGDSNLEAHLIGCTEGCDRLSSGPPPTQLVYVFPREHQDILSIFGKAWDATQTPDGDPDKSCVLQIDAKVPEADCPTVPSGCQPLAPCSDGCGKRLPPNCGYCAPVS